jgi:23S rRNA pseudouridine2605 synthase
MEDVKQEKVRLSKRLSELGFCSRRDAEELIKKKAVRVNGEVVDKPFFTVLKADVINVDGRNLDNLKNSKIQLFAFHKPVGYVVSRNDEKSRPTVYDLLPKMYANLIYVGRLDMASEGLLLFTNNGDFSRKLELPSTGLVRKYRVRAYGEINEDKLARMQNGAKIEGVLHKPLAVRLENQGRDESKNRWYSVSLNTGKNREIRKYFDCFGLDVNRLIRTEYGQFKLRDIPRGVLAEVSEPEMNRFIKYLK